VKILVVEDDDKLAGVLVSGLREQQIDSSRARDFAEGRERLLFGTYDVIVLDLNLPGGSGIDLCRLVRARGVATPILMLTARDTLDDQVQGLDIGADDYMTKPFAFRELSARLHALGRRQPMLKPARHNIADLTVDLRARTVDRGGRPIQLTSKEFVLLELFVLRLGEVVDRSEITAKVWDENHDPFSKVLEVLVNRLRRKIDEGFEPKLIHTFRGAGYRFGT
jgi:two-component system copper resistance phosphate regulon response regulator CusR